MSLRTLLARAARRRTLPCAARFDRSAHAWGEKGVFALLTLTIVAGCSLRDLDRYLTDAPGDGGVGDGVDGGADSGAPVPASDLATLAKSLAPGTWGKLRTTIPPDLITFTGGSVINYGDSAVWDRATQQFMFLGGAPGDGPTSRHVVYDAVANRWRGETEQPWFCVENTCTTRAYDHLSLDPARGEMFYRAFGGRTIRRYAIATKVWDTTVALSSDQPCCGGLAYFPEIDGLVFAGGSVVRVWKRGEPEWSEIANGVTMGDYHNVAEYDPVHRVVLLGGGNASRVIHSLGADLTLKRIADAPVALSIPERVNFMVEPVRGDALILQRSGPALYAYDATTDAWSTLPVPPLSAPDAVAASLPEHGVVMVLATPPTEAWLYRHK